MSTVGSHSPGFAPLAEEPGLRIVDPIERRQFAFRTGSPVRPESVSPEMVRFPVDAAASITTDRLELGELLTTFVHGPEAGPPVEVLPGSETQFDRGEHHVELDAQIKLYLKLDGPFSIEASATSIVISASEPSDVVVGARSYHERPAATVTTTDRPADLATVVSTFGSALKTTSPERAYPTLRGHPPAVELGEALDVPDGLEPPDTGVTIEVPPDPASIYVVAPLAYYLGATVALADRPCLRTAAGFVHPLGGSERDFQAEVERVLKQTFLLDCLVRTEGYYAVDLAERAALEPTLDLDFETLYDEPLARRVERYLEVPNPSIADHVPRWALTAHVPPTPAGIEAIPFVVNELAIVRSTTPRRLSPGEIRSRVLDGFFDPAGAAVRSNSPDGSEEPPGTERPLERLPVVSVEPTGSIDDAWFGDGVPLGATMGIPQAYRNRFERTPQEGEIEIAVVCNDRAMAEEGTLATSVYGSRDDLPFDVALYEDLDRESLADRLATDVDFLHYVGHISADGFHCPDGVLDAASLSTVGPDVFFLNGCESYQQGRHLIEGGCVGGVVTIGEVVDSGAATVGRTMARLLNLGFPLRTALALARRESIVGGQYLVVGDGNADVAATGDGAPVLCDVAAGRDGRYRLTIRTFLPRESGMGALAFPTLERNDYHHLTPGAVTFRVTEEELAQYLEWHPYPIRTDGRLVWNERFETVDW